MNIEIPSPEATEQQLRESSVPCPESSADLVAYITGLVDRQHDYGTSAYATSMAAVAAFQFVANSLGLSGFQASCADMDVLRRTRHMRGPFMLIDGANALYPQYDLRAKLDEFLAEIRPWLAKEAVKELESAPSQMHPNVRKHLQELASEAAV